VSAAGTDKCSQVFRSFGGTWSGPLYYSCGFGKHAQLANRATELRLILMRVMKLLLIALAVAGLVVAAPASKTWESLGQLRSGAPIEVVTSDHVSKGEFVASSTESLTIRTHRGEQKILRAEVVRVASRTQTRRARNALIGVGVGVGISLLTDQTYGRFLRNESNPEGARALIWTVPIVGCGGIGAAIPSYPVIYRK